MNAPYTLKSTSNTGELNKLMSGLPEHVLKMAGEYIGRAIGDRIKHHSLNAELEKLDPTSAITAILKAADGKVSSRPLVDTGAMTEGSAWTVTVSQGKIVLEMKGEHYEKWDNIIDIAEAGGLNWDTAFDLSEFELEIALFHVIRYINDELGISTFNETDLNVGELDKYYG